MWPHFRAAYNLARWLTRSHDDAEDIVQEAFLRAFSACRKSPRRRCKALVARNRTQYVARIG